MADKRSFRLCIGGAACQASPPMARSRSLAHPHEPSWLCSHAKGWRSGAESDYVAAMSCRTHPSGRACPKPSAGPRSLAPPLRSEEHTSELPSLMRKSYDDICLKKKQKHRHQETMISTR